MSGSGPGRPAEVTEWLANPFDDFFGNTGIAPCAVPVKPLRGSSGRGRRQKQRAPSPVAENSRATAPPRKRAKPCAADLPCAKPGRSRSQAQEELPWVERYRPETQNDLAVQKKKIEEVETWLKMHVFQRKPKQSGSVLLLTGPPGCGKTATLQILARDLGLQVQEWTNPLSLDFTKEDLRNMFGHDSNFHTFPSQAQAALFQDFLLRANKYNKLQMLGESSENDKKLILIEDIPNQFYRDPGSLHEILRSFIRTSRCPLVFIISDNFSGDSNQGSLFPTEIVQELCIFNISFKPVAPTNMMKVLNRIVAAEASMSREKNYTLDRTSLELLCRGCSGDIRSAINSLQFSSMKDCSLEKDFWSKKKKKSSTIKCEEAVVSKVRRKSKCDTSEDQEIQAIGGKDASIFLFHALGKIIYCKNMRRRKEGKEENGASDGGGRDLGMLVNTHVIEHEPAVCPGGQESQWHLAWIRNGVEQDSDSSPVLSTVCDMLGKRYRITESSKLEETVKIPKFSCGRSTTSSASNGELPVVVSPLAPPSVSEATQTERNCPMCHSVQSDTAAVPCGHHCCLGCLLRHTATSTTCPLCASPVLSARFSVHGRNDFLQCILSPPGAPPGPGSWARRALFRLVYTRASAPQAAPAAAEPTCSGPEAAEALPAGMWAELLLGHEHLLDPVRPWLRQSLDAIYGPRWWEARQVESIALSTLCICGPDRDGLTHMLRGYLGDYTAPLIHGLIQVTLHRCRDPWLQRRSQAAPEAEDVNLAAGAGPSWPGGALAPGLAADSAWPGRGNQPSEPEPARPEGPGRPPAAPAGQDQPWAVPQEDASAPGPSVPRRGRNRGPRPTRHSQRRRAPKYPRPLKVRRRKPRRN
ncbi:hypothetical protein DUI87_15109 [Hirundo rustica rustica]|uniref:Cell cycle checkpoint protein RAD17 n=1 Tax=Hirundo rustica rustica TaxID=333673 RepID=A0A3M0K4S1_HIRRU|nr:hypothetical protein DUI87_15109 [Hirundo rustica rustica]